ncbi:STAS domain-containing protein [Halobacillus naozhouensis]|uniref:STAS domain-containing protein n=1 Tax=Halobacillus naozhouensis TaxID=554880 RepID=A0ABY8IVR0_9BACI|nr:STAS domain-containing protein [Halobacillus naozhouensis]WFT74080.1 STAS domain-containing protein [Halobacillus naozhouensis]
MVNNYNLDSSTFNSLKTVSKKMFAAISKQLNVNTAYITKKSETEMTVLSSYNHDEEIIPEGYSVEYGGTYCRLIIMNENNALNKANLTKDEVTRQLEVTDQLQVKGFLGVTLMDLNGEVFGTLCVMDKEEKEFSEKDREYLKSMADILSHIIELDQTKYNMTFLNVPIIPITKGISILTLQGIIDSYRAEKIMQEVLSYSAEHQIDYFIIDVSGLVILDDFFPHVIVDLVKALQVMGIETIITGITPEIARHDGSNKQLIFSKVKTVPNLESALEYIGFYLLEK